jgi:exosortase/archaeosortase family protein
MKSKDKSTPDAPASASRGWWASRSPVVWFGLKFTAMMAVYYAIVLIPVFDRMLYGYLSWTARATSLLLDLAGQATHASEVTISSAHFSISVRRGCDAIEPAWFFCAAVLSFPAPIRDKIWGMVVGTVCVVTVNIVRLASLFLIGRYCQRFFKISHLEIWPVIFILLAVFLWIAWISWIKWPERHDPAQFHR